MPKPIFIIGVPSSYSPEVIENIHTLVNGKLEDYHVLILCNTENYWTVKLYAVEGIQEVDLESIKDYIKSKL